MSSQKTAVADDGKVYIVDTDTGTYTEASRQEPGPIESVLGVGEEILRQLFG